MNAAWWGKEASARARQQSVTAGASPEVEPVLVAATRDSVFHDVLSRTPGYTWDWTNQRPTDAGYALAKLFGEEMEPVLERVNLLPEKTFVEFLRDAGIQPRPPIPAQAFLQFTVSDSATQPIYVPQGFQVSAGASASGAPVIFETTSDLYAIPGKIQELYAVERGFFRAIDASKDDVPFQPFGNKPSPGLAFLIGIAAGDAVDFGARLSLGIQLQLVAGAPPPVSTGGVAPIPVPLGPLLNWQVLDGSTFRDAQIVSDETKGLLQSGGIVLRLPATWAPGIPPGSSDTNPLRWLRLQIAYGTFLTAPTLLSVKLNMTRALAVRTIRDEILTPVTGVGGSIMSLSQTPILPGSLILEVDDTADLSISATSSAATSAGVFQGTKWTGVDDLSGFGPDDEVYVLDPATGLVYFGDGNHGKAVPPGFRNVRARSYQVGGGTGGVVGVGKLSGLVNSVPFLSGATNPQPASGGMDVETQDQTKQRGPKELRAHGRAVAVADYEILALRSPGAQVARAHAVSGFHPAFPGKPIPGVVCVFVIPVNRGVGPPAADQDTLRFVSSYLSGELAPDGVEVVAAAPLFHRVRVIASVVVNPSASRADAVRDVLALLATYLDPVTGGEDGQGWPFGGTLFYSALVRRLLTTVYSITAVPRLQFVVDGVRAATCADVAITPNSLVWGSGHEVLALDPGEEP
jgi:predicted phage baseplate assembly protein